MQSMESIIPARNSLGTIAIVIVEPQGALNIGAIARAMKNMGLSNLTLVNPQCEPQGVEALRMAVHAKDILTQAKIVRTLPEALANCQRVIATTARARRLNSPLETPRQALPWLLTAAGVESREPKSALVFGREDSGLSNEELNLAHRFVGIPVSPTYESMNLAQAVTICAYELRQAFLAGGGAETASGTKQHSSAAIEINSSPITQREESKAEALASMALLEKYFKHLEQTLLSIQAVYPHTAAAKMAKLRRIYQRAQLTSGEVGLLRGILGQVDWYAQQIASQRSHLSQ